MKTNSNDLIGKEILNYRILSVIGSGGMGTVYLGAHKFISEQKVAIKVIRSEMVNQSAKERLKKEAGILASLNHPNIVKFLNYEIDSEGNIYLIMEYVEGLTLEQYIKTVSGLIVEKKVLQFFEPILDAVEYAHKKNIIHRDIKPSNIIITNDGKPKILDFGISSVFKANENTDAQEEFIMGTPSYMSPEQIKGKNIDYRSDIYSLGVLLYQMLTGNAPYDTSTMSEMNIQEKVITEPLPRMKSYYRYISDKMQVIVDKATAKDMEERYQTCQEFRKAMRKALVKEKKSTSLYIMAASIAAIILLGAAVFWDYSRLKVRYYKDYTEQWGIPEGIGKVSASQHKHMARVYRFEYRNYKLQRVSHVNGYDKLIDDGESERIERPVDMQLFYSDDNKVNRIKIMDRSGKTLYVKSFNNNLNAIVFQYDDEYGTEKNLSSQTIGYQNSFTANGTKGKISRWLIEYDENGYVSTLTYAGYQNIKVGDADNIYGRQYIRDDKGRIIEEKYLGYDGEPKATKWGMGTKKFYYDEDDNLIKVEYQTIDGEPARDDTDGTYIYTMEYDELGNLIGAYHLDANGNLMLPQNINYAGVKYLYDDNGLLSEATFIGTDGKPGYALAAGYAKIAFQYDENGYETKRTFYDLNGEICTSSFGFASMSCINDDRGNTLEMWNYDIDGNLTLNSDGHAGYKYSYDEKGNIIQYVQFGIDGQPNVGQDGTAGYIAEYNDIGLNTKYICIDKDLKPTFSSNGIAIIKYEYDQRGNNIKTMYYDLAESTLAISNEDIAGYISVYDDNGNETERVFINDKNEACQIKYGYSSIKWVYDEQGNLLKYRYYDLDGVPVVYDGYAGYDFAYDERGNIIEETPVGIDGRLANGYLTARYKYDSFDNITEYALFEQNGKAALNSYNYHKYECKYNDRNQVTETRYYGTDGALTEFSDDTYAIERNEYDSKGNRIKCEFFDTNEKPIKCNEGWASSTYEYDGMGRIIRQLFYDTSGKPTDPDEMVPEGICKYDERGNMIFLAAADGNGNYITNPSEGWSIAKFAYDEKGNITETSYFGEDEEPVLCNYGYHIKRVTYTASGKEETASFFGKNGEPRNNSEGYQNEKNTYDDKDRPIEWRCFNSNGIPVNCNDGFHKTSIEYDEEGNAKTIKYYDANGTKISSLSWNGQEWVQDRSTVLRNQINLIKDMCPAEFGEDYGFIVLNDAKFISGSSCEVDFIVPYSKYEMSFNMQKEYKKYAEAIISELRYLMSMDMSMDGIYIRGVIYDSKYREIARI